MNGTNSVTVLQGDAREQLGDLEDNSVNFMLTSPPYWGLRRYTDDDAEVGQEQQIDEYLSALLDAFAGVERVLTDDGLVMVNIDDCYAGSGRGAWTGGDDEVRESYSPDRGELPEREDPVTRKSQMAIPERLDLRLLDDRGWIRRRRCTWLKSNPMPDGADDRPQRAAEPLLLYSVSPDHYWDEGRPPLPEVIEHPTAQDSSDHPATMPRGLCEKVIKYACPPDGTVLDPFAGVGTVLDAAQRKGRSAVGVELDEEFAAIARRRTSKSDYSLSNYGTPKPDGGVPQE